jgi:peptidoglycan/xylan/chitin deacetylase (PgdA/CDA1 family)
VKDELTNSKAILENITGQAVDAFSYPFGRFNQTVTALVKESGYKHAYTMNYPNHFDDHLTCGRIPIYFFDTASIVQQKLDGGAARTIHKQIGRFINTLSYGTILSNKLKVRNGN